MAKAQFDSLYIYPGKPSSKRNAIQNGDTHIVYMHVACWSSTPRALQNRWLYMNMSTLMTVDNKWWHSSTCCCCQCSLVSAGHFQCYLLPPSEVSGLSPSTLPCSSHRRGRSMNITIHDARNRTHDIMYISTSCISHIMYQHVVRDYSVFWFMDCFVII